MTNLFSWIFQPDETQTEIQHEEQFHRLAEIKDEILKYHGSYQNYKEAKETTEKQKTKNKVE